MSAELMHIQLGRRARCIKPRGGYLVTLHCHTEGSADEERLKVTPQLVRDKILLSW